MEYCWGVFGAIRGVFGEFFWVEIRNKSGKIKKLGKIKAKILKNMKNSETFLGIPLYEYSREAHTHEFKLFA